MFIDSPSQGLLFAVCFALGLVFSVLRNLIDFFIKILFSTPKNQKFVYILTMVTDFVLSLVFFACLLYVLLKINYGIVRVYELFSVILGDITWKGVLGKVLAKPLQKCYSFFANIKKRSLGGKEKEGVIS
ncbi:MAG: spore cortex biosynthesis protein YabQ [Clostridia bacterium]